MGPEFAPHPTPRFQLRICMSTVCPFRTERTQKERAASSGHRAEHRTSAADRYGCETLLHHRPQIPPRRPAMAVPANLINFVAGILSRTVAKRAASSDGVDQLFSPQGPYADHRDRKLCCRTPLRHGRAETAIRGSAVGPSRDSRGEGRDRRRSRRLGRSLWARRNPHDEGSARYHRCTAVYRT